MRRRNASGLGLALALICAGAGHAEVDLDDVKTCIADAGRADTAPAACIDAAHADCAQMGEDMQDAAQLCYIEAREVWSGGITAQMEALREDAREGVAAVAGIEVKYDILSALLQCDRLEELALLTEAASAHITRQRARCEAAASGLAYARLVARAQHAR